MNHTELVRVRATRRLRSAKRSGKRALVGGSLDTRSFGGLKVVRFSHAHPDNYFDRMLLHTSVAPDGQGGTAVALTLPLP